MEVDSSFFEFSILTVSPFLCFSRTIFEVLTQGAEAENIELVEFSFSVCSLLLCLLSLTPNSNLDHPKALLFGSVAFKGKPKRIFRYLAEIYGMPC